MHEEASLDFIVTVYYSRSFLSNTSPARLKNSFALSELEYSLAPGLILTTWHLHDENDLVLP